MVCDLQSLRVDSNIMGICLTSGVIKKKPVESIRYADRKMKQRHSKLRQTRVFSLERQKGQKKLFNQKTKCLAMKTCGFQFQTNCSCCLQKQNSTKHNC